MTVSNLQKAGIIFNKWTTLQNVCKSFLLNNDGYLYVSPKTTQFYFESSSNLVFIRNFKTPLSKTKNNDSMIEIDLNDGKILYANLYPLGIDDKTIGKYHSVYDLNQITGIVF